jgi:hypothetical protein
VRVVSEVLQGEGVVRDPGRYWVTGTYAVLRWPL